MVNVSNHGEKLKGAPQGGRFDKESDLVDGLDLIYDAGQPLHAGRARVRLRHVRLGAIPMFKRSHHRSDFIEDEDVVAQCSVNEPGTVRVVPLASSYIRETESKDDRIYQLDTTGLILS